MNLLHGHTIRMASIPPKLPICLVRGEILMCFIWHGWKYGVWKHLQRSSTFGGGYARTHFLLELSLNIATCLILILAFSVAPQWNELSCSCELSACSGVVGVEWLQGVGGTRGGKLVQFACGVEEMWCKAKTKSNDSCLEYMDAAKLQSFRG